MKNALLICSMILFSGCTKILMHANGYKSPRYESNETITQFAKQNNFDLSQLVLLKDSSSLIKTLKLFSNSPGIIIADANFKRLNFKSKKENCSAPVENLLRYLCEIDSNNFYVDEKLNLLSKEYLNISKESNDKQVNYYIYFLWNKSMGKNIHKIKVWESILKEHATCNYRIFWINSDYMARWFKVKPGKKIRYKVDRK